MTSAFKHALKITCALLGYLTYQSVIKIIFKLLIMFVKQYELHDSAPLQFVIAIKKLKST